MSQPPAMTKKEAIHSFIQPIYAFVIGFGFFTIESKDWNGEFSRKELISLLLYLFTFFIAAHDWLEYHKKKLPEKLNFVKSIPQMCSLLAIGFMFSNARLDNVLLWCWGAIVLTVSNLVALIWTEDGKLIWNWGSAVFLLLLAIFFTCIVYELPRCIKEDKSVPLLQVEASSTGKLLWYIIFLVATVILVWVVKWFCFQKRNEAA